MADVLLSTQLVAAPFLAALLTAVATLLVRRWRRVQTVVAVGGAAAYLAAVAALARAVLRDGALVYQLSNWPAPYGITFVADALAAYMLAVTGFLAAAAVVYGRRHVSGFAHRLSYTPLFFLMLTGITGAFLTGDLFNLFVWFEVMLMSSYVLVAFYGDRAQTRAALHYVVINLIGSSFMLVAIGGIYATTGTLNMADLGRRLADPAAYGVSPLPVLGLSAILLCVFALKAGLFPFQFWVPAAYSAAPAPVAAMLAGATKKVGIYAIIRLHLAVLAPAAVPAGLQLPGLTGSTVAALYGPVLLVMATGSILIGGLGAVAQDRLDGLLAYSSIGQVGFIVLPLGLAATAPAATAAVGVTAALLYTANHALAKGVLFMVAGRIHALTGSLAFTEHGSLADRLPVHAAVFAVAGLSLIGIPPTLGFVGKLQILRTAAAADAPLVLGVAVGGAVLTLAYITRAWNHAFWGGSGERLRDAGDAVAVVAVLGLALLVLGVAAQPLVAFAQAAADAATHPGLYRAAVLGGGPG